MSGYPRVIFERGRYRIVQTEPNITTFECLDGHDAMGKQRWSKIEMESSEAYHVAARGRFMDEVADYFAFKKNDPNWRDF